ncbi:hypothetical protein [Senegalia massiliensis]|uniref:Uncharacterized protein n=1 Tax=Senegalia massiliensis TaxID=1720316 RepID=A0A845QXF1_9CLOT|nr:hypothetical protein [Senegalia massiliensis]NBI07637.1 hypothetical protein [Senegalia massiliensis]
MLYREYCSEPTDSYNGIYNTIEKERKIFIDGNFKNIKSIKMPMIGEKIKVNVLPNNNHKNREYIGIVIDKQSKDHILVKNIKTGCKENFYAVDKVINDVNITVIKANI